jgi:hypothetical protein
MPIRRTHDNPPSRAVLEGRSGHARIAPRDAAAPAAVSSRDRLAGICQKLVDLCPGGEHLSRTTGIAAAELMISR